MPFKTFTAGSAATSSDAQTYFMNQAVIVCTSGTRPGSPVEGMSIYETDTDKRLFWDGATWNLPKNVAGGVLGLASVTANQTGITTEVDLTGLSVTVTVGASRRIKVSGRGAISAQTATAGPLGVIQQDAANVGRWIFDENILSTQGVQSEGSVYLTPTAGAHTYKLRLSRYSGTGTITLEAAATNPAQIVVEDVGGV